jgi:hypothetical protein
MTGIKSISSSGFKKKFNAKNLNRTLQHSERAKLIQDLLVVNIGAIRALPNTMAVNKNPLPLAGDSQ